MPPFLNKWRRSQQRDFLTNGDGRISEFAQTKCPFTIPTIAMIAFLSALALGEDPFDKCVVQEFAHQDPEDPLNWELAGAICCAQLVEVCPDLKWYQKNCPENNETDTPKPEPVIRVCEIFCRQLATPAFGWCPPSPATASSPMTKSKPLKDTHLHATPMAKSKPLRDTHLAPTPVAEPNNRIGTATPLGAGVIIGIAIGGTFLVGVIVAAACHFKPK
jgi:hypothetical protein